MTDLVIGNILGRQDTDHTFHGKRFRRVNTKDTRSRIFRADRRSVDHSIHLDIIRVFAITQDFRSYVDAEASPADTGMTACLDIRIDLLIAPQNRCREHNTLNNFLVACASAYVAPDCGLDIILGRIGICIKQSFGGHDHTRRTETALDSSLDAEPVDKGFLLKIAEAFDSNYMLACYFLSRGAAGLGRFSVDHDSAGAACTL